MKRLKKFEEFINEAKNGYAIEAKTIKDLIKAVNKLPDTIEYVNVQTSLDHHNPDLVKIMPNGNWKKDIVKLIKDTLKGNKEIDTFSLISYYSAMGDPEDPYYIRYTSKASRKFNDNMLSGKHGKLD